MLYNNKHKKPYYLYDKLSRFYFLNIRVINSLTCEKIEMFLLIEDNTIGSTTNNQQYEITICSHICAMKNTVADYQAFPILNAPTTNCVTFFSHIPQE